MQTFSDVEQINSFLNENSLIYYRVTGGLGNQLFGLNEAFTLSRFFGKRIAFDVSGIQHQSKLSPDWLEWSRTQTWLEPINFEKYGATNLRILNIGYQKDCEIVDSQFYTGWKFSSHRVEKGGLFRRGEFPFFQVDPVKDFLGIHFRAGDYRIHKGLGVLDASYYKDCLERLNSDLTKRIYSDDFNEAKQLAQRLNLELDSIIFPSDSAIKVLADLSSARQFISANSTLSWWAIYFGNAEKVMAPDPFYLQDWKFDKHARWPEVNYVSRFGNPLIAWRERSKWGIYLRLARVLRKILKRNLWLGR